MAETSSKGFVPEVKILCGLPASGKSILAHDWVKEAPTRRVRVNYDDLRAEMFGPNWNWNIKQEKEMQAKAEEIASNALTLGMSVVVDNTNTTSGARERWKQLALKHNVDSHVEEVGTNLSIWDLVERDARRTAMVGRAVIERMALFNGFIDWNNKTDYYLDGFVVCDLDGTLADITHRRHFVQGEKKDWKSFFENVADDKLNGSVADMLDMFAEDGYHILLVSGRPITPCGIPTQEWLSNHGVKYDHLFMRQGGDHRSDVIIKQEILDYLPIDRIDYVLDDRNSVVEMWRKNGLFCLQVADGDF